MLKNNIVKFISAFIAFVIVLGLLPLHVFASSFGNMEDGSTVTVTFTGQPGSVDWNSNLNSMNGYKISVWYSPIDLKASAGKEPVYQWGTNQFQIGQNIYWRDLFIRDKSNQKIAPSFWGSGNIYSMTTLGKTWEKSYTEMIPNKTEFRYTAMEIYRNKTTDYFTKALSWATSYEKLLNADGKNETEGQKALRDWINRIYDMENPDNPNKTSGKRISTGKDLVVPYAAAMKPKSNDGIVASGEYIKSYFENPIILNEMSYATRPTGNTTGLWGVNDFITGKYIGSGTKENYQYTQGQYKIFIEPVMFRPYNGSLGVMTWREMMAEYNEAGSKTGKTAISNIGIAAHQIANALRIEKEDSVLNINGTALKHSKDMAGSIEGAVAMAKDDFNGLGVGIITSPSLNSYHPGPEILKTYVMVDSVDADGTVHYKKAAPSTKETAQFNLDADGNITKIPVFESISGANGGVALLNDIVSTDKDFSLNDNSEWVETTLPTNIGVDLKPTSDDVAGYVTGLITGSELFIDTYREAIVVDDDVLASYKAVAKVYEELKEKDAGVANETTQLAQLPTRSGSPSTLLIKVVDAVPYVYFGDVKLGQIVNGRVEKIIDETADATGGIGIVTPANNLILRYILKPNPSQINVIEIVDEETGTSTYLNGGKQNLLISGDVVTVQKPEIENMDKIGEPEQVEWVTNSEYPVKDISSGTLPSVSEGGLQGTTETTITSYPQEPLIHNLYVKWRVIKEKEDKPDVPPVESQYRVPEWRLSRFWKAYDGVPTTVATMSLPVTYGCCSEYLTNSGAWNYTTRNPNGELTVPGHLPENLKLLSWVHSETVHSGSTPYVGIYSPSTIVPISGNLTAIKSTDTSGLKVANWLDKGSIAGLTKYDVSSSSTGSKFEKKNYSLSTSLNLGTYNLDSYTNGWTVSIPVPIGHSHYWTSRGLGPSSASYGIFPMGVTVGFDRYVQQNTDSKKLKVTPEVKSDNAKTTLKYQLTDTLNIYPEYGMLFANDNPDDKNQESIKWVVGDQARKISPVVYQTLQHKVYVVPSSNGTSVATDSRAISSANKLGESNKQVVYKGAGLNTAFKVLRDEKNSNVGLLTVKTYALDFKESANVKSAWGNGEYNSKAQHTALLKSIDGQKYAKSTEKLLIDSPAYNSLDYNGAIKSQDTANYKKVSYSGDNTSDNGTVTIFTHELLVRGGAVIGVNVMSRDGKETQKLVPISELKAYDESLYEAILAMNLYNESIDRSKTVFSTFEHLTGDNLDEGKYGTMLGDARKTVDKLVTPSTSSISEGKGWYSEDTTVLVIKEYVTNYEVPSISYGDKISLSVKGLETPIDKASFFKDLGKGYTYLKYDFPIKGVYTGVTETSAYFEFSSYPKDDLGNGEQKTNYLVPNVSVTDSTSLH